MAPPRSHRDIDLLLPAPSFAVLDRLLAASACTLPEIRAKRFAHKRAFCLEGVAIEVTLVKDADGSPVTRFWGDVPFRWLAPLATTELVAPTIRPFAVVSAANLVRYPSALRDHATLAMAGSRLSGRLIELPEVQPVKPARPPVARRAGDRHVGAASSTDFTHAARPHPARRQPARRPAGPGHPDHRRRDPGGGRGDRRPRPRRARRVGAAGEPALRRLPLPHGRDPVAGPAAAQPLGHAAGGHPALERAQGRS